MHSMENSAELNGKQPKLLLCEFWEHQDKYEIHAALQNHTEQEETEGCHPEADWGNDMRIKDLNNATVPVYDLSYNQM